MNRLGAALEIALYHRRNTGPVRRRYFLGLAWTGTPFIAGPTSLRCVGGNILALASLKWLRKIAQLCVFGGAPAVTVGLELFS
jgi:hypothetical protein